MADAPDAERRTISNAVCTRCGCTCDDVSLTLEGGVVVDAQPVCERVKPWFLGGPSEGPAATLRGTPVDYDVAVARAAEILASARRPLVFHLGDATSEAQRVAIEIADRVGGVIDVAVGHEGLVSQAMQNVGQVTCTLGEVRNRADVVVFWRCDPERLHHRLMERICTPKLRFESESVERRILVVDDVPTEIARSASLFLQVDERSDFEILWALRGLLKGILFDEGAFGRVGLSAVVLGQFLEVLKAANYGVFFFDPDSCDRMFVEAILLLVRELNAFTSFAALPLSGTPSWKSGGNVVGAENVLTWQTGYPFAVDFSRGRPRFGPGEFSAGRTLENRAFDAALIVGEMTSMCLAQLPLDPVAPNPAIFLGNPNSEVGRLMEIAIAAAPFSTGVDGTVYRMDDVPLPLRMAVESGLPSTEEVLRGILKRLNATQT